MVSDIKITWFLLHIILKRIQRCFVCCRSWFRNTWFIIMVICLRTSIWFDSFRYSFFFSFSNVIFIVTSSSLLQGLGLKWLVRLIFSYLIDLVKIENLLFFLSISIHYNYLFTFSFVSFQKAHLLDVKAMMKEAKTFLFNFILGNDEDYADVE